MHPLRDVPGQPVLPQVIRPDGEGPAVAVRHDERLLMQDGQEPEREEVEEAGEEHRLDVGDELSLADETVQAGRFLQALGEYLRVKSENIYPNHCVCGLMLKKNRGISDLQLPGAKGNF